MYAETKEIVFSSEQWCSSIHHEKTLALSSQMSASQSRIPLVVSWLAPSPAAPIALPLRAALAEESTETEKET
jgi:hypothetical protein